MNGVPDFALGSTIDFKFTTRRFTTGAPFALASGVISVYVDNDITQLTAGITLTADFDGVTGLNNVRAVLTSGNGYAAGTCLAFVITTGTVDSVSVVGETVYQCTLEKQSALRPATAGRTLVVDAAGLADSNVVKLGPSGSGTAQTAKDVGGAVPAAAAGASGGLLISGSNAGTTTLGALTVTGSFTISDGLLIARSSANQSALVATGNGTGHGALLTSGSGATGNGFQATAASTNGSGISGTKTGSGSDLNVSSTPIQLAKTTNITGFNDIAATAIVSGGAINTTGGAVNTVTAVTDPVIVGTVNANAIATASFQAGCLTAAVTDATFDNSIADALLGRTDGIETGITPKMAWRAIGASAAGVLAGAATANVLINELGGTSFTRINAVVDANGNRSTISLSL